MRRTFKQRVAWRWGRGLHSLRPAVAAPEFRALRAHLRAELEAVDGVEDTDDDGHASTLTARVVHEDLWGEGSPDYPLENIPVRGGGSTCPPPHLRTSRGEGAAGILHKHTTGGEGRGKDTHCHLRTSSRSPYHPAGVRREPRGPGPGQGHLSAPMFMYVMWSTMFWYVVCSTVGGCISAFFTLPHLHSLYTTH